MNTRRDFVAVCFALVMVAVVGYAVDPGPIAGKPPTSWVDLVNGNRLMVIARDAAIVVVLALIAFSGLAAIWNRRWIVGVGSLKMEANDEASAHAALNELAQKLKRENIELEERAARYSEALSQIGAEPKTERDERQFRVQRGV